MGVPLFGLDIAGIVSTAIEGAGGLAGGTGTFTLVKVTPGTRNPAAPLDGTNPTETQHACSGFGEDPVEERRGTGHTNGDIITVRVTEISILGASIAGGVEPMPDDKVIVPSTIQGIGQLAGTWFLENVKTDGARALFVCRARSGG